MNEALPVGLVELFQLLGGARAPDELMTRQNGGGKSALQQTLGCGATDHVDDHRASHGGSRAGGPAEARQLQHAVAGRTLVVDDDVCAVDELLGRSVGGLCLLAVRSRDYGNHRKSTLL